MSQPQEANADQPAAPEPDQATPAAADAEAHAAVVAERDKLRDQLLRTAADFDNFRKRTRRDLEDAKQRGKDEVIRELLPVFDNLERAVQTADSASDVKSVLDGVRMVLKLFEDTAERMGLARVPGVGERFDPAVHEAIQQQETDAHPPGTIIAEVAPGYRFGQRLVRPGMVVVARKPAEPKPASQPPKANGADPGKPEGGAASASASGEAQSTGQPAGQPPDGGDQKRAEPDAEKTE